MTDSTRLEQKADSLTAVADFNVTHENYTLALNGFYSALDCLEKNGNREKMVTLYYNIITTLLMTRNFELVHKYLNIIDKTSTLTQSPKAKIIALTAYADYYIATEQYDSAINQLYQGLPIIEKIPDLKFNGYVFQKLGDAYIRKKAYGMSAFNYNIAVDYFSRSGKIELVAIIETRLAHIYYEMGFYRQSLRINLQALKIRQKLKNKHLLVSSLRNVGEDYMNLDEPDSARYYFSRAIDLIQNIDKPYYHEVLYSSAADLALQQGLCREALAFRKKSGESRIRLNLEKTKSEIIFLDANREINATEARITKLEQENRIQKLMIRNRKLQTIGFEVTFLSLLSLIFTVEFLTQNIRRKRERLLSLNRRLTDEINENIEAGLALRETNELHRFLTENTADVIALTDSSMKITFISSSCLKLFGFTPAEILDMESFIFLIDGEFRDQFRQNLQEVINTGKPTMILYRSLPRNGVAFWTEAALSPIILPDDQNVSEIIFVIRDHTGQKKFEDEINANARQKEVLLREVHSRVKNNFAILSSLLHLQTQQKSVSETASAMMDLQLRIRAMALVHEMLFKSSRNDLISFHAYLQELCANIAASFKNDRIEITSDVCQSDLPLETALPVGLIINELLTNAYKHAFPDNQKGKIRLSMTTPAPDHYCVLVSDNGTGMPDNYFTDDHTSMGSTIIRILVNQIEGQLTFSNDPGATIRIEFSPNPKYLP